MKISEKMMAAAAKAAKRATVRNVNATCNQILYQPKVPAAALALKK